MVDFNITMALVDGANENNNAFEVGYGVNGIVLNDIAMCEEWIFSSFDDLNNCLEIVTDRSKMFVEEQTAHKQTKEYYERMCEDYSRDILRLEKIVAELEEKNSQLRYELAKLNGEVKKVERLECTCTEDEIKRFWDKGMI